ncbi:MAG: DUF4199 domain-containing protein [Chryseolinea sp.]
MEETEEVSGDKRMVGIKYGLIATVFGIVFFLGQVFAGQNPYTMKGGWVVSVLSTALFLFLAHKEYKNDNNGFMSYGDGLLVAVWYTIVSVVVGMLFSYIYVHFIDTNIMKEFWEKNYEEMQQRGQSDDAIEKTQSMIKSVFWGFAIFFAVLISMGVALIVTIFTQKKPPEQRF